MAVVAYKNLGQADINTAWDGPSEKAAASIDDLKLIAAWYDSANPDIKGSYKLLHHHAQGHEAVWGGVSAAMGALLGARGGVRIPDAERKGVYNHLAKHYAEFDKTAPEFRSFSEVEERQFECDFEVEERADGGPKIVGYPAMFNKWSVDLGGFRESISQGAFKKTIQESDIRALFNHDPNYVLGRNTAQTLKLSEDSTGLRMEITPPQTNLINDMVIAPMKRGDINQGSFKFKTIKDNWATVDGLNSRTLQEVRLFDVSPVTFPAYPETIVQARALEQVGIRIDEIEAVFAKVGAGDDLDERDIECLQRTIQILNDYIPLEPDSLHSDEQDEPARGHSIELMRMSLELTAKSI